MLYISEEQLKLDIIEYFKKHNQRVLFDYADINVFASTDVFERRLKGYKAIGYEAVESEQNY
ncbi:hypothetical protein KKC04_04590 [Patescibacteria group bacterium]|nr:hypothetical protein [Patescibacteria group bacterium]